MINNKVLSIHIQKPSVKSYDGKNKKTEYAYDKNKRLLSTLDPCNHTESHTCDNLGNIKEKMDGRTNKIVYKYDIMCRVEEVRDSTVLKSKYTYYIDGALKEQKIGNATTNYVTTYTYNPFGMVASITDPTETGVPTTEETYEYYSTGTVKSKILIFAEVFNGTGYADNGHVSPYLYSGTNIYSKGKYESDGKYNPNFKDKQGGVYILLNAII